MLHQDILGDGGGLGLGDMVGAVDLALVSLVVGQGQLDGALVGGAQVVAAREAGLVPADAGGLHLLLGVDGLLAARGGKQMHRAVDSGCGESWVDVAGVDKKQKRTTVQGPTNTQK